MDIFDLSAKITLDSSGFEQGVNSASSSMDGLSAKAVALGTALYDIGKKAVSAFGELSKAALEGYANFEQLSGGIDTLFGSASDAVMKNAEQAFRTAGMSMNSYMETAIGFSAALINSVGGDTERAADLADRAITDMSDNANKMGTTLESLQNAYRGFSRGNFTMLDNLALGFSGTKEGMQELLDKAEELSGVEFDISSYADIVEAIHVVQTEMGITGTTAAEAAGTISGSVQTMKSAWDNWLAGLGNANADMSGLTDNLIDSVQTVWSNVEPTLSNIKTNLVNVFSDLTGIDLSGFTSTFTDAFGGLSDALAPVIDSLQADGFAAAFDTLLSSFESITGIDISPFTTGIQTLMSALDGLKSGGASGALENIVSSFEKVTGLDLSGIKENLGQFGEAIDQVANAFKEGGLGAAVDELMTQLDSLTGLDVSGFFSSLGETYDDLVSRFNEGGLKGVFEGLVSAFQEAGPKIAEFGRGILDSIGQLLDDIGERVYNAMPENVQALIDSIGNMFTSLANYLQTLWAKIEPLVAAIAAIFTITLVEAVKTAWDNIKNAFDTIVEGLTAVFDFMAAMYDAAAAALTGDFEAAAEAIKSAFSSVLDFFQSIADGIKGAFENTVSFFSNIGARMADGLKSGFAGAVEDIKGIASNIATGFKDFFGIKSPSRLFAKYGSFMAEGLGEGWDGKIDSVVRDMSKGVNVHGTVDFASSSLGKSSAAQINTMLAGMEERGGNYNINLVVDGRTLANVVFDPLNAVSKQKGVAIGA
jgi:phage-related protein